MKGTKRSRAVSRSITPSTAISVFAALIPRKPGG
jgi:hypothetical protein